MSIARTALLSPIEPAKATDQVIQRISVAISSGVFKPGDQLPVEAELAAQLNVAQMTLRQALAILRDLGIIETVRGRNGGSFVTTRPLALGGVFVGPVPTMAELQDLTDYRMALENEAAALAAIRADRIDLGRLNKSLETCLTSPNEDDHAVEDNSFHICIAETSHSYRLVTAMTSHSYRLVTAITQLQHEMTNFYQRLTRPNEAIFPHKDEHINIVRAIESGDADAAWEASNVHLYSTSLFLESLIKKITE